VLFFIDESWQATKNKEYKVAVLAAVQIESHCFNDCSTQIFGLKIKSLGYGAKDTEIKGKEFLKNYYFKLEARGIRSAQLDFVRTVFEYIKSRQVKYFASITFASEEIDLVCANPDQLERPFFFLFERIDLFMRENYPGLVAKIVFDDRGTRGNKNISKSVSNFFHKSAAGKSFDTIMKVPFFAISTENIGIQMADLGAYALGARFSGNRKKLEFFDRVQELQYISKTLIDVGGRMLPIRGIKTIKGKRPAA